MSNERNFLTRAELATAIKLSQRTIIRKAEIFPSVRVGRRVLYPSSIIDELIQKAMLPSIIGGNNAQ